MTNTLIILSKFLKGLYFIGIRLSELYWKVLRMKKVSLISNQTYGYRVDETFLKYCPGLGLTLDLWLSFTLHLKAAPQTTWLLQT
jgi:hypothetical protein